jgi:hypothetical protein
VVHVTLQMPQGRVVLIDAAAPFLIRSSKLRPSNAGTARLRGCNCSGWQRRR